MAAQSIVSTHAPVKARQGVGVSNFAGMGVSTHAPVKARQFVRGAAPVAGDVSTHAPVKARRPSVYGGMVLRTFQPTRL